MGRPALPWVLQHACVAPRAPRRVPPALVHGGLGAGVARLGEGWKFDLISRGVGGKVVVVAGCD